MGNSKFITIKNYLILMRFHKPIGILLLLWPTLWALWIASHGTPPLSILIIFIIGTIIMRAAGCVINDLADRKFDPQVSRTAQRPLATGVIQPKAAIVLFIILILLAFGLVSLLNQLTLLLALIGGLLTIIYPFSKRFINAPQFILGLAFAWGIPMAFAAVNQQLSLLTWILFAITALWIIAYDTEYAMADQIDDLKIGVRSTAIWFGRYVIFIVALLQLLFLASWFCIAWYLQFTKIFYLGLIVVVALFAYQLKLIQTRQPHNCTRAFINNHWVGLILFINIVMTYR